MSWDVLVMRIEGEVASAAELDDDRMRPLGDAATVRQQISQYLPEVDWSDPTWGHFSRDDFSFEFNMGDDDPIDSCMIHVRGSGDAIAAMLRFAQPNGWTLLDCSTGQYIDPKKPSQQGWEGFQEYRDRMLENVDDEQESESP